MGYGDALLQAKHLMKKMGGGVGELADPSLPCMIEVVPMVHKRGPPWALKWDLGVVSHPSPVDQIKAAQGPFTRGRPSGSKKS